MKITLRNILSFMFLILLLACTPQGTATLVPTPAITNTPPPTATLQFTKTLESTPTLTITNTPVATTTPGPTHTPVAGFPLDSCPQLKEARISSAGVLEVLYDYRSRKFGGGGEGPSDLPTPPPWLAIYYSSPMLDNHFWLWSDDAQKTTSFTLPLDAVGPEISADYQWVVFRRDFGEVTSAGYSFGIIKSELWVMDINGQNEKKLTTVSINEVKARNPNIQYASLDYGWAPRADKIYYKVNLVSEGVSDTTDSFALIDILSGETVQLAQPGKTQNIIFAPDGSQAAILTANELPQVDTTNIGNQPAVLLDGGDLRIMNTNDGSVEFTLPIQIKDNFLKYSPDGKYMIGLSYNSIIRINAKDGAWQKIPLNYTTVSGALPKFTWVDNSTILVPVTNLPEGVREIGLNDLLRDPDANFTIWRVNLTDAVAQPVQTFSGDTTSIQISPDGSYLTFQKPGTKTRGGQPTTLSLADLNTGNIVATFEASDSLFWSPNSDYYIYVQRREQEGETVNAHDDIQIYVSQIGKEPILLESLSENILAYSYFFQGRWVDKDRFILDDDCQIKLISVGAVAHEVTLIP